MPCKVLLLSCWWCVIFTMNLARQRNVCEGGRDGVIFMCVHVQCTNGGTRPPTFSDSGDIICHVPAQFLFRFRNILVSHQAVPLTFYNKIALMNVHDVALCCNTVRNVALGL